MPLIIRGMRPFTAPSVRLVAVVSFALLAGLSACTPALNWRDVRPPDSAAQALFPCKPEHHTRRVMLAGAELAMHLSSCTAADNIYALGYVDVGQADRVTPVLQALREAAAGNMGVATTVQGALVVPGMTPHPLAQRLLWQGHRTDGSSMVMQAAFFTQGTQVYQATVVGSQLDREAVDTFLAGLRLR